MHEQAAKPPAAPVVAGTDGQGPHHLRVNQHPTADGQLRGAIVQKDLHAGHIPQRSREVQRRDVEQRSQVDEPAHDRTGSAVLVVLRVRCSAAPPGLQVCT